MEKKYIIGIDAGGTKVAYGLFNTAGELLDRCQHPTAIEADGPTFCDELIENVHNIMNKHSFDKEELVGIGVCMPSFIFYEEGSIFLTSAMVNIKNFPMRDYMQERLGVKVVLDNDANVAALAEHRRGAGRGTKHMIYCAVSTGVGAGLIINNELFHGSYGWAGENGHMLATPDSGLWCGCENKGCYMSHISGRNLPKRLKVRMLEEGTEGAFAGAEELNGEALVKALEAGDPIAEAELESMAYWLGVLVFNMYQLLNINVIVFGGGLVNLGPLFFAKVRATFDRFDHIKMPVEFRFAELKQDFGIIGACELLMER